MADTSNIAKLLAQLDAVFGTVAQQRAAIDKNYGTDYSPVREQQLKNLDEDAKASIAQLRDQIGTAFTAAKAEATVQRNAARAAFSTGPQGRAYREGLAAYGTIAAKMPGDVLAGKLADALDAGLTGEAKALAEVARTYHTPATMTGALSQAVLRADREAFSQAELAAQAEADYLATAEKRYALHGFNVEGRLEATLNGRADYAAGLLGPGAVLNGDLSGVNQ